MDYFKAQDAIAEEMLSRAFAGEWRLLDAEGRALCVRDFIAADGEEEITAAEYARYVGPGNLAAYADVMRIRARKGW